MRKAGQIYHFSYLPFSISYIILSSGGPHIFSAIDEKDSNIKINKSSLESHYHFITDIFV